MDDLRSRFHRLDRVTTPDLWYEAVQRAVAVDAAPQPRPFNAAMAVIAMALLVAALAGTIAVGAWLNRPSPPTTDAVMYENGMIAASGDCGGVVSIDPSSLATRELVAQTAGCEFGPSARPAWSLDGRRLAYLVPARDETQGTAGAWIYDGSTGDTWQVAACPDDWCDELAISPDGSLVAQLACCREDGFSFVVTGVDSARRYEIDLPPGSPRSPVFSPDGTRVALALFGGRSGVYVVDLAGMPDDIGGSPVLLHGIVDASDLAWSLDGEWIAMTQVGGLGEAGVDDTTPFNQQVRLSGRGIVVVRTDGSEARVLATGSVDDGPARPTWSSDSRSIAYLTWEEHGLDGRTLRLWTVGIDGGEPAMIYESDCCIEGWSPPAWSPDGRWIAFAVDVPGNRAKSRIVLVRPDGSDVRYSAGTGSEPAWQPIPKE